MATTADAFTAEKIGDYGDIMVMAVDGNYDGKLSGGINNSEPREEIAKEFYKSRPDDYDFLFIFSNFDFQMPTGEAVAFYMEVKNDVAGIGRDMFDNSWLFGSNGHLQGTIDMGNIAKWAIDPLDRDFTFLMTTMSHELLHRWAAYVQVKKPDDSVTYDLLGQDRGHWSFLLDTKGSLMYGNAWQDNRDGTFTSMNGRKYYSPLDLYLMGLVDKSAVPPMLLIESPETDPAQLPKPGTTVTGTPQYVTIDDIIAAEGDRFPDHLSSQKNFKIGCIFITRPGDFSEEVLPALRTIFSNWVIWHSGLTDGRSTIEYQYNPLESLPFNTGPGALPHVPRPTPAEVEEAVAWLIEQQNDDGSWTDSENSTEKDTAAALTALKPFSQAEGSIETALQWIEQNGSQVGTDFLARLVEALVIAGASSDGFHAELTERQNPDGAWGPDDGYMSSSIDTALVLRARMAAGQLDFPQLSEVINYLILSQNLDGGWGGGPQASDIQTTANVLHALAPLRVPYELGETVQQGLDWLYDQQQDDGGFGEGASTVYDTAAVLMVLKRYDGDSQYYGPAIDYLQSMQSFNGSWHSSVFETAVAAESLYAWKDSVDADLAILSTDIVFSPATITGTPETVTIDVTVHNNGLADADDFDVELYEESISADNLLGSQRISLAGQSSATVQFVVTFSDTLDHRLFGVADAGGEVIETNETNNTALAILSNDLNMEPDLQVRTDDMFFTPAAISQMPADITLEATVHNAGMTDVPAATVSVYQDFINESAKVGEQQIAVGALSSATLSFAFTVTDGETHRFLIVVDPAGEVAERNEHNNTAIKQLTSNPAYDFGLRADDLSLSVSTAEMGQPVTITALIRNFGNRDGYNVPVRFYLEKEGVQYDIATLTFDLPAGSQVEQQVVWTADRAGSDMRIGCRVDPLDVIDEVSETNNTVTATVTVNPYPDPNLLLNFQSIAVTPSPARQGAGVTITATIANTGGGPADDVQVDFALNKQGQAPTLLGSRTITAIAPGGSAQAEWVIDNLEVSGLHQFVVTVDPGNTIAEIFEDDNSAFVDVEILSLPDLIIEPSSIRFTPAAPADGETVSVTVTVQNAGGQSVQDVPVALSEGAAQIGLGVIANIAGHSQAEISFDYDTTGKSGAHYLQVAVDPDRTLIEQRTDNNTAGRTLGIQNSDLWLSQEFISAGGNPEQGDTTLFFRLGEATDVEVVVVNEKGDIVRTFNGDDLIQTTGTSITWDGRNERGALVPDGVYQIQVRDLLGNVLLSMAVTVDNNLSHLVEAAGTEFLSIKGITCTLPYISKWQWFPDESGMVFMIKYPDADVPYYPPGVYTMAADGSNIQAIVPPEWSNGTDPTFDYAFRAISLSPDGNTVAVVVYKNNRDGDGAFYELWCMDRFGNNRSLIDTMVARQEDGTDIDDYIDSDIQWSADSARFTYIAANSGVDTWGQGLRLARPDGTEKVSLPFHIACSIYIVHWAPDGERLFYIKQDDDNRQEHFVIADRSGQTNEIYQLPPRESSHSLQWIDATKSVFIYADDDRESGIIVVVDALNGQALEKVVGGSRINDLAVHPDGSGFVFTSDPSLYWGYGDYLEDGDIGVQYCDIAGTCEILHQRSKHGYGIQTSDLSWSPRGDKLVFTDNLYEQTGENEFAGHVVVMDWPSRQIQTYPVSYPVIPDDYPESFYIYIQQNDLWVEQGVLHYGSNLETKSLLLPELPVDAQGHAVLRIVQSGTDEANVDFVALSDGTETFLPSRAVRVPSQEDILQQVLLQDGQLGDVTAATVAYEWENLPQQARYTLVMHANEVNYPDGPGDSDSGAADKGGQAPYEPMAMSIKHWFNDGRWLLGYSHKLDDLLAFDSQTGEKEFFGVDRYQAELSPLNRHITFDDWGSDCYGDNLQVLKSLLNLTAELKVAREDGYIEIYGTASDRNFDHYLLEYAHADDPDLWHQVRPPSENIVIDEVMAHWLPPHAGIYTVRLTARDKAGHTAVASRRVSWGLDSPVTNLYLDHEYISPNGDSVQDALQLHYTVQEAVNLEFYIYNQQSNQRVATILRSYADVPPGDGKDLLSWDGRDDNAGQVVPDGAYIIEVLGYTHAFVVDNTPPEVSFELNKIESDLKNEDGVKFNNIRADLRGTTLDANFKQWSIEHGKGDSPLVWNSLAGDTKPYGSIDDGRTDPETIYTLGAHLLGSMAGHKFRITVEDRAGNRTTAATERMEELLILDSWKKSDEVYSGTGPDWTTIPATRLEDGSFQLPGVEFLLPITNLNTDRYQVTTVNTIRAPVEMILQYRTGMQWHDGPQLQEPVDNSMAIEFLSDQFLPVVNLESINALRLKGVDANAVSHFSNIAITRRSFRPACVARLSTLCALAGFEFYPFNELTSMALYIDDLWEKDTKVVWEWKDTDYENVPMGQIEGPFQVDCEYYFYCLEGDNKRYQLRISAVDVSGRHYSETQPMGACPEEEKDDSDGTGNLGNLVVTHPEATACNSFGTTIQVGMEFEHKAYREKATRLAYYIQRQDDTWELLGEYDIADKPLDEPLLGMVQIDTFATDENGLLKYAEGKHRLKVDVAIPKGDFEIHYVIDTLKKKVDGRIKRPAAIALIDRTLPEGVVSSPLSGGIVCPQQFGSKLVVTLQGTAQDNHGLNYYLLQYGYGHDVLDDMWYPAKDEQGNPMRGNQPVNGGTLGSWDVTNLLEEKVTLRLVNFDTAGNLSCVTHPLHINTGFQLSADADKKLFSPNGDGVLDNLTINYTLTDPADITATVLKEGTPVKTIASALAVMDGEGDLVWDGSDDSAAPVADGFYTIRVTSTDSCGNERLVDIEEIEVDRTPPTMLITYPQPADTLGVIVEVRGTVEDLHFAGYRLALFDETHPEPLQTLTESDAMVTQDILGRWNTYGVEGVRLIKLTAWDTVGNSGELMVRIDLGERSDLITDLAAVPDLFSPNSNGLLDSAAFNFGLNNELNKAFNVTLELLNSSLEVVRTFSLSDITGGTHTLAWDGLDTGGLPAADGAYQAVLTASLAANPAVSHQEKVTVVLDTVAPAVLISEPPEQAYIPGPLAVQGAVTDTNLESYLVTLSGAGGDQTVQEGNVNRQDYTFATLNDLADGPYTLSVHAVDRGRTETRTTTSFTVDKTAPQLTLDVPQAGAFFGSSQPEMVISGTLKEDNIELWQLRYRLQSAGPDDWTLLAQGDTLPGGAVTHTWPVGSDSGVADGRYIVSLYAADKAGWEHTVSAEVIIDNTVPEVGITTPAPESYVKAPLAISGTADDANLVQYTVDSAPGECPQATQWSPIQQSPLAVQDSILAHWRGLPPDGTYCLRVIAEDAAQHSNQATVQVLVDTHPPQAPQLTGAVEELSRVRLIWTAVDDDDLAGYIVYRNGIQLNSDVITAAEYVDTDLTQDTYTYTVHAVDGAGWQSSPSNPVALEVDLTPPAARIGTPQESAVVTDLVDILGTAYSADDFKAYRLYAGLGTAPTDWQLIGESAVPTSYGTLGQWDTAALINGEAYSIKLEAEDLAGNIGTHQVVVTIDNLPPAAPVLLSAVAQAADGSNVDLAWEANDEDDLAGYLLYRNDELVNANGAVVEDLRPYLLDEITYPDLGLADGSFEYYLLAMDTVGNISLPSNRISLSIDTHAPKAVITTPEQDYRFDRSFMVQATCPDQDIATIQLQYRAEGAGAWSDLDAALTREPYIAYLNPVDLSMAYGRYELRAVASDMGGQTDTAPAVVAVAYGDITPPAAPVEFKALVTGGEVALSWEANSETDLAGYNIYELLDDELVLIHSASATDTGFKVGETDALADKHYRFQVMAVDGDGNQSQGSDIVQAEVYTPWMEQPYTPTSETPIALYGQVPALRTVTLSNDTGSGPLIVGTTTADDQGNFYLDLAPSAGTNRLSVTAGDDAGNTSKPYEIVVEHGLPPSAPVGLTYEVSAYDVLLSWDVNGETDLAGYNLYRDGMKQNEDLLVGGGTASASENASRASYARSYSGYWYGNIYPDDSPMWWQLTLPESTLISRVELRWNRADQAAGKFEIQAWSGYAWIPVIRAMGNTNLVNTFDFDQPYPTDRIRLAIPDDAPQPGSYRVALKEFKLWRPDPIPVETYLDDALADGSYSYHLEAVSTLGMVSLPSESVQVGVGDVTPPVAPTDLIAVVDGAGIDFSWTPPGDLDLAGYHIYRLVDEQWQQVNPEIIPGATYAVEDLANGSYSHYVTAVDTTGNESDPSDPASVTVAQPLPEVPVSVTASPQPQGGAIEVCWDAVDGAAGYRLYRSATAGGPYAPVTQEAVTATCYLDSGLTDGTAYYYMVRVLDALGNESADSLEAEAIPADLVAPPPPVLFAPTAAGRPITIASGQTHIIGWAEPGATVELYRNEQLAGTTQPSTSDAADLMLAADLPSDRFYYDWDVSPDGRYLVESYAYWDSNIYQDVIEARIHNLASGTFEDIPTDGVGTPPGGPGTPEQVAVRMPVWSPDSTKLAYRFYAGGDKLAIYDHETKQTTLVTPDQGDYDERSPVWSSDGEMLIFSSNRINGVYDIFAYRLADQSIEQWTDDAGALDPQLSSNGRYLSYMVGTSLYLADLESGGDPLLIASALADDFSHAWASDGQYLVYLNSADLYGLSPDDPTPTQVTVTGDLRQLTWLPGSRHLALVREIDARQTCWILTTATEEMRPVAADLGSVDAVQNDNSGRLYIFVEDPMEISRVRPAGRFLIGNAALEYGENLFTASAADAAGNRSPISEDITVIVDADQLPDIVITAADLFLYPHAPINGDRVLFSAVVQNDGLVAASDVQVDFSIWDSSDVTEIVYSDTIAHLGAGELALVQFEWDSSGMAGKSTLIVDVDINDEIYEAYEFNNMAFIDFYVAATEGLHMITELAYDLYSANEDVNIAVEFCNTGQARDVTLLVEVLDAFQQPVATVGQSTFQLPYTPLTTRALVWHTGTAQAGDYYVRSVLSDQSGQIAENLEPFTIEAAVEVAASLVTNQLHYQPHQTVQVRGQVTNQTPNMVLADLTARMEIRNEADEIVHQQDSVIDYLFADAPVAVNTTWDTGVAAAGTYTASLAVSEAGTTLTLTERTFYLDAVSNLGGSLSVQPALTSAGTPVTVHYSISHFGNAALSALPVTVAVVDPDTGADLAVDEADLDIDVAGTVTGTALFDTSGYAGNAYPVELRCDLDGETLILADALLTITSPVELPITLSGTLTAEPAGATIGTPVVLSYTITNEGSQTIDALDLHVTVPDGVSGEYARTTMLPPGVTLTGTFEVPTDRLVPDTYQAELLVTLTGDLGAVELASTTYAVVEPGPNFHLPVAIAGGPYLAAVGETVQVDGSQSYDEDEGLSESGEAPFDTLTAYDWEIHMVTPYDFDDATGVAVELPGFDTPGLHTIVLRVTDNTEAAFPSEGLPDQSGTGTAEVDVYTWEFEDLGARPKATKCQLTWSHTGADLYEILRSESGPNIGFEVIATTTSTYSTYLDTPIEMYKDYWYRVRSVAADETRLSTAVHVYSVGRTRR